MFGNIFNSLSWAGTAIRVIFAYQNTPEASVPVKLAVKDITDALASAQIAGAAVAKAAKDVSTAASKDPAKATTDVVADIVAAAQAAVTAAKHAVDAANDIATAALVLQGIVTPKSPN